MKGRWLACVGVMLFSHVGDMHAQTAQESEDDMKAVNQAAEQFYSALNAMFAGDLEPMKEVWSQADDVTYMGPGGGLRIGWAQVLVDWEAQAAMRLGGEVRSRDMRITVGRDLAVVTNYEVGENVGPQGERRKVEIRATNVFRNENGKWKMIGHHTDTLPFLQE